MQGRNTNIIKFMDSLKAFMSKLENWKRKVKIKNVAMFEQLSSVIVAGGEDQVLPEFAKNEILQHLTQHWIMNSADISLNSVMRSWI